MVDDGFFKFCLDIAGIIGKSEKFKNCGIFDEFQPILKIRCFFLPLLRCLYSARTADADNEGLTPFDVLTRLAMSVQARPQLRSVRQ